VDEATSSFYKIQNDEEKIYIKIKQEGMSRSIAILLKKKKKTKLYKKLM